MGRETMNFSIAEKDSARIILDNLDGMDSPEDLVGNWQGLEKGKDKVEWVEGSERKEFVDPSDIVGTDSLNVDRFKKRRLWKTAERVLQEEYFLKPDHPPCLQKVDGKYYVGSDGNHRCLVFKFIGAERLYAEVNDYETVGSYQAPHQSGRVGEEDVEVNELIKWLAMNNMDFPEARNVAELIYTSFHAFDGDAFARSQIRNVEASEDVMDQLAEIIGESDLDYSKEDVLECNDLMRFLYSVGEGGDFQC